MAVEQLELRELEKKCTQESPPACTAACPLHVDVRGFMQAIRKEDFSGAAKLLEKKMPFPGILGRICDHPCQNSCTRREVEAPIAIGALERYCVENYPVSPQRPASIPVKEQRVAVAGGGLSGLTAAWDLIRKGYQVEIFEQGSELGGKLLSLEKKLLPRQVVDAELSVLAKAGAQIHLNSCLGKDLLLTQISGEFAAVYLACGSEGYIPPEIRDEDGKAKIDPLTFATPFPGVFAGGSMRSGGDSFVKSASDGRRAALSIDRYLQQASLTAARENEGEFVTNLYVNTKDVPSVPPVKMANPEQGFSREEAIAEAGRCLNCQCLECVKACKYMENFGGYPKKYLREIYNNDSIVKGIHYANKLINSCNLCGQCAVVCPNHLDLGEVIKTTREKMVERGKMPPSAHDFALRDMKFSNGDQFELAKHQPGKESSKYAFFPGCQLSASSPDQVEQVYRYLQTNLSDGVGLMLRCCGAPAEWAGRRDLVNEAQGQMRKQWEDLGRPVIITACSTCFATFKPEYPEVVSLWEVIRQIGLPEEKNLGLKLAVHDACTTRHEQDIHDDVREILKRTGCEVEELPNNRERTECCGYGGLMWSANPELSRQVAAKRTGESSEDYVVYCAMCRDSFAAQGKRTVHLLDVLFKPNPSEEAGKPGPGFSARHENRARLKSKLLREMWREEPADEKAYRKLKLIIPEELKELLESRRILVEDIQRVIEQAESKGRKFINQTGHNLAYFKPASVTYWVEYGVEDNGFRIFNAYSHRMEIVENFKA